MNEETVSMGRLSIAAAVICVLDILWIHLVWHTTRVGSTARYPLPFDPMQGHLLLGAAGLAVFLFALKFHGLKSLLLLLIPVIIFPAELFLALIVACAFFGECL